MYTVGQLAKRFGLSRSALLYYDSIKLLTPSARSASNYRLYNEDDVQRLQQICDYREAGLELQAILQLLDGQEQQFSILLNQRLQQLNREISRLRQQQQIIVRLLQHQSGLTNSRIMNKERWVKVLQATGLDEPTMEQWHIEFERLAPEAHQDFLESLGLDKTEITAIRDRSQLPSQANSE